MNHCATREAAAITDVAATGADLPESLARIRDEALAFQEHAGERARTARDWQRQVTLFRQNAPAARIEDDGDTICSGDLSPGCVACKTGRWDCLFLTLSCNLQCPFCLTPRTISDQPVRSALSVDLSGLCAQYARTGVQGVGISGGEPFLQPDVLLHWVTVLRQELPDLYLWAYTNGVCLTDDLLAKLAEAGLNELRFNLAATAYRHPHVLSMLYEAARRLSAVAVEVPAIPEHRDLLLGDLEDWAGGGVRYLNLHELIHDDGSPSENMPGARLDCRMPDGHPCAVNPASAELVATILARVAGQRIPLAVNYCSLRNKARQLRGRRRLMAPGTLQPHERLREDGSAESLCIFDGADVRFIDPSVRDAKEPPAAGGRMALMRRLPPLSCTGDGQWVHFELLPDRAGKS